MNAGMMNATEGFLMKLRLLLTPAVTTLGLGIVALVAEVGDVSSQTSPPLSGRASVAAVESPMMDEAWAGALAQTSATPGSGSHAPAAPMPAVVPFNEATHQVTRISMVPSAVLGHDQWLVSAAVRGRLVMEQEQVDWAALAARLDPAPAETPAAAATPDIASLAAHQQLALARQRATAVPVPPRKPQRADGLVTKQGVVSRGKTLSTVLTDMGVDAGRVLAFLQANEDTIDPRAVPAGQRIEVDLAPGNGSFDIVALRLLRDQNTLVATADPTQLLANDAVVAALADLDTDRVYKRFAIQGSVIASAQRAGIPAAVVTQLVKAEGWRTDLETGVQPNQVMEVMFHQLVDETGKIVRTGDVQYASLWHGSRREEVYRYEEAGGQTRLVSSNAGDAGCRQDRQQIDTKPVDRGRVTSPFGWRWHPVLHRRAMHKGVDYGAPRGTPIRAAADGVVEQRRWANGYGRFILIRHNDTLQTAYAHMQSFNVTQGQRVRKGQIIGRVGSSGWSTGPHLHFEVRVNGVQRNPLGTFYVNGQSCGPSVDPDRLSRQVADISSALSTYRSNAQFADAGG